MHDDSGFSLVEMMVTVAIVAILCSIGVHLFKTAALKSKTAEATTNLGLIREAQIAYKSAADTYIQCGASPPAPAGTDGQAYPWVEMASAAGQEGFAIIGFEPIGPVRYQYEVSTATQTRFVATAVSDLDADGNQCTFTLDTQNPSHAKPVRNPADEY
jgi:prepilin-type N-terminal cleavage/methylation domain-containing protein